MGYANLEKIEAINGKIWLKTRFWDGIDRPQYEALEPISPEMARYFANRLDEEADKAIQQLILKDAEKLTTLKAERSAAQKALAKLEKQIAILEKPRDEKGTD